MEFHVNVAELLRAILTRSSFFIDALTSLASTFYEITSIIHSLIPDLFTRVLAYDLSAIKTVSLGGKFSVVSSMNAVQFVI